MRKKVLILGAGNAQIDAIEYCRAAGLEVHGCSYRGNDPGVPLLDAFVRLDIRDVDGVCRYAGENGIDGVYSIGSDLAIPTAMAAGEALGLPHFISAHTAATCQNKWRMRGRLAGKAGSLPFAAGRCADDFAGFGAFPCMLKPVDSQGQRGCYRVDSYDELCGRFADSAAHSASGHVIAEKYVDGPEISVNAYVVNGELAFFLVSDRIVFEDLPGGIIREHHLPSVFAPAKARENIRRLVADVLRLLDIRNGPVYFQMKLEGDAPYLIEVAPRLDGCHMWNLIKHYCGVDLLDMTFKHLLANRPPRPVEAGGGLPPKKLVFLCSPPDAVFDRGRYRVAPNESLFWYYQTGETVRKLNGHMEKCGYLIR